MEQLEWYLEMTGRVCGGRARWYDHYLNALSSEATACRDGIQFALDRGVQRLVPGACQPVGATSAPI
jgi:hypothetical protein